MTEINDDSPIGDPPFVSHELPELVARLDSFDGSIPANALEDALKEYSVSLEKIAPAIKFDANHYVRNQLHVGAGYQMLVLCWRNGQRSPIHDHPGSGCAVRVLMGSAVETVFKKGENEMIYAEISRELHEGQVISSFNEDIHQISNLQGGNADLITLHVYSPPLISMQKYSLETAEVEEFDDPIRIPHFTDGGGI